MVRRITLPLLLFTGIALQATRLQAQVPVQDTLEVIRGQVISGDTVARLDTVKRIPPRVPTIRSAIIPGWGQATNRKYWKIPIVYTAIGIPVGTFLYNRKWYRSTRDVAVMIATNDTANYRERVDPRFYIFFESSSTSNALTSLSNYRNEFRRNMDYSILFVLLFWGLNVVDAAVDAHLRYFDVSDNLSLGLKPTLFNQGSVAGLSLVVKLGKH